MRIALLSTSGLDNASPRGRWLPIARELAQRGHEPHLLMLHPMFDQAPKTPFTQDDVRLRYVGQMHVYGSPGARRYYGPLALAGVSLRGAWALARAAIAAKPDIVHVCKPQPINGLAGLIAARWLRCKLFVDCDDYEAEANRFSSGIGGRIQKALVKYWEDTLPRLAHGVTVNTHFLEQRNAALGVPANCIAYVPNGIAPRASVAGRSSVLGLPSPIIIYVGTMSKIAHGVDLLIAAFAQVLAAMPSARLLMVGDGDDKPALMAQAEGLGSGSAITWTGNLPSEKIGAYWAQACCSVDPVYDTPSARGRSPLKIVESMAAGVPVVTGDVGDRREMLGDTGRIVAPGDAVALAQGLLAMLRTPQADPAPILAQAAHYAWPRLAERWLALYGLT